MLINNIPYSIIRCDPSVGVGGGVCLFYDNTVSCIKVSVPNKFSHLELLYVDVLISRVKQHFILRYNPPGFTSEVLNDLCGCLEVLCDIDYVSSIIDGFNMPDIVWNNLGIQPTKCAAFINFVLNNGVQQLVNAPTRDNNILNLILCNDNFAVTGIVHLPPFSTSDHSYLAWQNWFLKANNKNDTEHIANYSSFNFAKADYDKLRNYFSDVDWLIVFAAYDPMTLSNYGWPSKLFYSMLSHF